jgi:hypothetical protein
MGSAASPAIDRLLRMVPQARLSRGTEASLTFATPSKTPLQRQRPSSPVRTP